MVLIQELWKAWRMKCLSCSQQKCRDSREVENLGVTVFVLTFKNKHKSSAGKHLQALLQGKNNT